MCGIYGEVSLNQTIDHLRINKNLQLLDHRGPDDEGIWINDDRKIAFGFKRLSIIDLSKRGNQPMIDSSNNYVIIFNGEIYNFKKLKKQLQKKGHQFKSISDTEVLLKAYIEWPNEFILKIEGMFSIAIFDKKQKKIILARDPAGQKPLYYYHSESEFKFSSELKPIINSSNSKSGIRNKSRRIFPRKLIKKLIPKIGINIKNNKEYVNKLLLELRKEFMVVLIFFLSFFVY